MDEKERDRNKCNRTKKQKKLYDTGRGFDFLIITALAIQRGADLLTESAQAFLKCVTRLSWCAIMISCREGEVQKSLKRSQQEP